MLTCTAMTMATADGEPTERPRVTPPNAKPHTSSAGLKGGISKSLMLPCILAIISDEVVLAKAF